MQQPVDDILEVVENLNALTDERLLLYLLALALIGFVVFMWAQRGRKQVDMTMLALMREQQAFTMRMQHAHEDDSRRGAEALEKIASAVSAVGELIDRRSAALASDIRAVDAHLTSYEQTGSKPLREMAATVSAMFTHVQEIRQQVGTMGGNLDVVIGDLKSIDTALKSLHQAVQAIEREARALQKRKTEETAAAMTGKQTETEAEGANETP